MHTAELDSAVRCTLWSFLRTFQFITWLCGVMHTAELDSLMGCTPRSLTPRCDAHLVVWLRGMMHTAESDSRVGCTPWRFFFNLNISQRNRNRIRKYFSLFIRGPDRFESWKKTGGRKSRDTLPLRVKPSPCLFTVAGISRDSFRGSSSPCLYSKQGYHGKLSLKTFTLSL